MQQKPPCLVVSGVSKRYPAGVTIGPVSFEIQRGEFFSLLGPSGCGKTTILRCIAGFEEISEGQILLNGEPLHTKPAHRRNVGLVFQSYALFPHLTIFENIAFGLRLRRVPSGDLTARVDRALELVGMPELAQRFPAQISGGQQQRAAIARAVVLEPALILFDEPLSNLDLKLRVQLRFDLRQLQRRLGMTSIFVTHDQSEALALSDRMAVLSAGKVEQIGSPVEIYERPLTTFVADFIGSANLFDGTTLAISGDAIQLRLADGTLLKAGRGDGRTGDTAKILIRPEHLHPVMTDAEQATFDNVLHGVVEDMTYLGEDVNLRIAIAGESHWLMSMKGGDLSRHFRAGDAITVGIAARHVHVLPA